MLEILKILLIVLFPTIIAAIGFFSLFWVKKVPNVLIKSLIWGGLVLEILLIAIEFRDTGISKWAIIAEIVIFIVVIGAANFYQLRYANKYLYTHRCPKCGKIDKHVKYVTKVDKTTTERILKKYENRSGTYHKEKENTYVWRTTVYDMTCSNCSHNWSYTQTDNYTYKGREKRV